MFKDIETGGPCALRGKLYSPANYDTPRPLLLFQHGIKETGSNLDLVLRYGPLDQIEKGVNLGPAMDWFIAHFQNPSGAWSIGEVDEGLEHMLKSYPVDPDRIYLMGASLGGKVTWEYACSPAHVKKLAAIIPICGGGNDPKKAFVMVDEGIPGWAAHAESDDVVDISVTTRMVNAVNTLAGKSQILFSKYGMHGHGAWNYFLRPEYGVYDWLSFQRKSHRRPLTSPVPSIVSREITITTGEEILIKVR